MTNKILTIILTSAGIASIITLLGSFLLQFIKYKHDYFNLFVEKRLEAYSNTMSIVGSLRTVTRDDDPKDPRTCHWLFSNINYFSDYLGKLAVIHNQSIYMSNELSELVVELIHIFTGITFEYNIDNENELLEAGKECRELITKQRNKIEKTISNDLKKLYDVKRFLKRKESEISNYENKYIYDLTWKIKKLKKNKVKPQ